MMWSFVLAVLVTSSQPADALGPYDHQVAENIASLNSESAATRAAAVEALGFLRAYAAESALIDRLKDPDETVRRQAVMALGWCGGRTSVEPLMDALGDSQWLVRQAAHISLTNLTGQEFPFDGLASLAQRGRQVRQWRTWWSGVSPGAAPADVMALVANSKQSDLDQRVRTSSTYKGPPGVLLDGSLGPGYWQTKNVPFPQWCTIDLGSLKEIDRVVVYQYGPEFVMTDYELAVSRDNEQFDVVQRSEGETPVDLEVAFAPREVRFVRITSYGSKRPIYPTTFREIRVGNAPWEPETQLETAAWKLERGLRALGVLGGEGACRAVLEAIGEQPSTEPRLRPSVRAGIRALGRLGEEAGFERLLQLLDDPFWARAAAEALGDLGDPRAVPALLAAYTRYAKDINGADPPGVPRDDKMGFPSEDRMLETPYAIAYALCRLPLDDPQHLAALREIAPQIMANLPGDHDTFMLYEPEVGHLLTRHLMNVAGLRQEACEQAFLVLGQPRRVAEPDTPIDWSPFDARRISSWLPCVCTESTDLVRLLPLLEHENGWVRINAAKALAWLDDKRAIEPIARLLAEAKAEADYGYSGTFKDEEYNDPAPRWREALIRALGLLGADGHTDLIARILNDERSVVEIRLAAARALGDLGTSEALDALEQAAWEHPIHSVRNAIRDALRQHGREAVTNELPSRTVVHEGPESASDAGESNTASSPVQPTGTPAILFIKGSNNIPNTIGTVEQADRWRQTYAVTDSGPAYRPGRNLYILEPPYAEGRVRPLTDFADGYVAEPELSWDASRVIFCRRGESDPWWQLWQMNVDGSERKQLTTGPYHHVGPAYLPDGRIVFASSRNGVRDEYHGYPCTALHVMNPDGSDIHPIAMNIGRDNEPSILPDGRIVFSRLEVFYSRNKTELTLHAAHPDGTQDVVLYGPERRQFWRSLDHGPKSPADGQEAPLTHRVLRMTQPQGLADGRGIVVATQGGLAVVGPRRDTETLISPDYQTRAYTTPWPMPDGSLLCATAVKTPERSEIDLGLYRLVPETGALELIYNDPSTADFEPRPLAARRPPTGRSSTVERHAYSGQFLCASVFNTQEKDVVLRGRYVRVIEGMPMVGRHSTQTNPDPVWKNHGGTFARVLGTVPLAADGSFYIEVPADRLLHHQVLDSNRRVVGNQLTWIYPRPGETKSCVGCHENPHTTTRGNDPLASHYGAVDLLPRGDEFTYRAKAWFKGHLPPEIEERTRTVRAVNLLAR
jgi:HEAT repeat protein